MSKLLYRWTGSDPIPILQWPARRFGSLLPPLLLSTEIALEKASFEIDGEVYASYLGVTWTCSLALGMVVYGQIYCDSRWARNRDLN
jgi:hypothetical protein